MRAPGCLSFKGGSAVSCGQIPVTSTAYHLNHFIKLLKSETNSNQIRKKNKSIISVTKTFSLSRESFFQHILLSLKGNHHAATFVCCTVQLFLAETEQH